MYMYSNINGKVLACFYENKIYSSFSVTVFDIKNDLKKLFLASMRFPLIYSECKYLISSDKKRIIIYSLIKNKILLLYYDINVNKFSSYYFNSDKKYYNINILYFKVAKKYLGSFSQDSNIINIIEFNKNEQSLNISDKIIIKFDNKFFYMKYILIAYSILFKRY